MNKSELIDEAAEKSGVSKKDVGSALDGLLKTIEEALQRGEKVSLTGFGTFEARDRAARTARNPQTGAEMQVPASRAPAFKAGKTLKDAMNA